MTVGERLREIVDGFQGKKCVVVGDVMLDEYIWGEVDRISPEAPVPVVRVRRETRAVGGAGNVALNTHYLGLETLLVGVVGADYFGKVVTSLMKKNGLAPDGIVSGDGHRTIVKTRIIAHSQQVVRIDREDKDTIPSSAYSLLVDKVREHSRDAGFIIVSDYNKGTLTKEVYSAVVEIARERGIPLFVDPKRRDVAFYKGCTLIKPNKKEAELFSGIEIENDEDLLKAGRLIMRRTRARAVLVTRGPEGMTLLEKGKKEAVSIPALTKEVYDVTGAGDTVISTVAASFAAGADLREASLLSNIAASVVVSEVGTSPITVEKLVRAIRRFEENGPIPEKRRRK
ncbi:MAG: D-glycero-beta-D-manno-heptose-7-phosphate kinase [Deltaproteobacteria bacterium]|nr:MAG: D-glycero-beta-D-manno-heptose-7-phosphate kinase [Deltaproteobacteria bacterium]